MCILCCHILCVICMDMLYCEVCMCTMYVDNTMLYCEECMCTMYVDNTEKIYAESLLVH